MSKFAPPDAVAPSLAGASPVTYRQERLEHEYVDFDDLQPRTMHVDVAQRGDGFVLTFAAYRDGQRGRVVFSAPVHLGATDLEDALTSVRDLWFDIAMSGSFADRLEGDDDEYVAGLRALALAGRRLWTTLFKRERKRVLYAIGEWLVAHPPREGSIIQISIDRDAAKLRFPWSAVRPPNPQAALTSRRMRPGPGCALPHRARAAWHGPGRRRTGRRCAQDAVEFMLWDQFRNASQQKALMDRLREQAGERLTISTPPITDADTCYALLSDCKAQVLYFFTHGHTRERSADMRTGPDLERYAAVGKVQPQVIFHLAAQPIVRRSYAEPLETFETNALGTAHLLEAVRKRELNCIIVVITSDKCYENREWEFAYRENDALGATQLNQEQGIAATSGSCRRRCATAFLVLAQTAGGLSCSPAPPLHPRRRAKPDPDPAAQGQARQPLERLQRGRVPGRLGADDRRSGPRRADDALGFGVVGLALLILGPSDRVLGWLGWVWPLLLALVVVWSVRGARRSLHNWSRRVLLYPAFAVLALVALGGAFETVMEATTRTTLLPAAAPTSSLATACICVVRVRGLRL